MRLLFVTQSLVHGGAERHTITLANRLAERGHECHAVYVKNDASQLERYRGMASITCLDARKYLDWKALQSLTGVLSRVQPTHIIAVNPYALLYAWLAARRAASQAPLAVTFHTTQLRSAKEWLKMLYYRPLFWSADWLVFVCEAQARYWRRRKLFARRTEVIYNGVDVEHWRPFPGEACAALRKVLGFSETDLVIGMSAVLRPEKNHLQLIDAIAHARRRGIAARALLIGDGVMRPAIEARAASLGLAQDVLITGLQQDVRPLVSACDAIALCSTSVETFSLAALEAMALGRPVVHAEIGGAAEMLRPWREGFLFPVGDTRALVERLAALADPRLRRRLGAQARQSVEERFSERVMVDRYETSLQELAIARSKREHLRRPAGAH
jgi:glycosyltransferase involved in cell wall biosynthesis